MSLQDHFHPPLSVRRHWHSFHLAWATYISAQVNERLPEGYFAEPNVQFGIEIDVATFDENAPIRFPGPGSWSPPEPQSTLPVTLTEALVEVGIFSRTGGPTLAGAIELVSPANKDRPATRDAFVSKCVSYVQQGIGLIVIDVVTDRHADFHADFVEKVAGTANRLDSRLFAGAYRPVQRSGKAEMDIWCEQLAVGRSLPVLPLWLRGDFCIPVDLQASYERTCREQKLLLTA